MYYPTDHLWKIGRTVKPLQRWRSIKQDLPGNIYPIFFPVFNTFYQERWVGNRYKQYKHKPKGYGANAGANEFFRLNLIQVGYIFYLFIINSLLYFIFILYLYIIFFGITYFMYIHRIELINLF